MLNKINLKLIISCLHAYRLLFFFNDHGNQNCRHHTNGIYLKVWRVEWNITGAILASSGDDGCVRLWKGTLHFENLPVSFNTEWTGLKEGAGNFMYWRESYRQPCSITVDFSLGLYSVFCWNIEIVWSPSEKQSNEIKWRFSMLKPDNGMASITVVQGAFSYNREHLSVSLLSKF